MPKRRPVIEFRDLSGFRGSPPSGRKRHRSSRLTDESPRPPSVTVSSRHRSVPSYRSHLPHTPNRRRKRRKRRNPRRAHHSSNACHRRISRSPVARRDRTPPRRRGLGEEDLYMSPEGTDNVFLRSPGPSGYPDEFNPAERAVDPQLEHTFSPTGLPVSHLEGEDSDREEEHIEYRESSRRGYGKRHRAGRHHGRHRRGHHRSGRRHQRRRRPRDKENSSDKSDQEDNEKGNDGTEGRGSDSKSIEQDEEGNPSSDRKIPFLKWAKKLAKSSVEEEEEEEEEDGKSKKKKKKKKKKKRNFVKYGALLLGAVAAGLVTKQVMARRRKKKAEEEAEIAAAHEAESEAAGPYGGSGGQLFIGSNPLQLKVPKTTVSVKVPESEAFIVERGGKYNRRLNPGSNTLIPFVDQIAFRFSLKEVSMPVPPQQCYTRENIGVIVSAVLFAKVEDAVAAAYGVDDARRSLMLVAQISMRKEIAKLGLEQMLSDRDGLGDRILENINRASRPWGVRCTRFEVRDFDIPREIREAFARQAQIERQVQADILASQGANEAMRHRADGELHAQMRMSQAQGINAVNKATAEAQAISERGQAIAGALRDVAEVANEPGGKRAMHMRIAEQYIHAYMKATEGREDLPPIPSADDIANALDKGLGLLDTFTEPGTNLVGASAALGESTAIPPAEQAPEHESDSGHDMSVKPTSGVSMSESHTSMPAYQMVPGNLPSSPGTPQVEGGVPPLVGGTQSFQQAGSSYSPQAVPSETEHTINSQSTQRAERQVNANQKLSSEYGGLVYPQA